MQNSNNGRKPDKNKIPKHLKSVQNELEDFNNSFLDNLESIAGSLEVMAEIEEKRAVEEGLFTPDHFSKDDEPE